MSSGNNQPVSAGGTSDGDQAEEKLTDAIMDAIMNTVKLEFGEGLSLQKGVTCLLHADLELDSDPRTVMIYLEFTKSEIVSPDVHIKLETPSVSTVNTMRGDLICKSNLVIPFGWTNLQTLNYSDNLPPVNDPGCVIDLAGFARPKFSGTYGQAGAFIEMKSLLEQSIARMVCRNSVVKAKAKTIAGVRHINFRIDGGYTGQLQSSLLLTTEQIKETSVMIPVDPERAALFFEFLDVETGSTVGA